MVPGGSCPSLSRIEILPPCTLRPNYRTGMLTFTNWRGQGDINAGGTTIGTCATVVRTVGSAAPSADDWPFSTDGNKYFTVVMPGASADYRYHITKLDWTSTSSPSASDPHRFVNGDRLLWFRSDHVGDVSPVFYIHWEAHQCPGQGVRVFSQSATLAVVADEEAVAAASGSAVTYDDVSRVLAFRLEVKRRL